MTPVDPMYAAYGAASTEAVMAMLFSQSQDTLTNDQLGYIQRSASNTICTLNNVHLTLVNVASGIERNNNMLADENAATAFLYSIADHLASISKTLELAEMARVEMKCRADR